MGVIKSSSSTASLSAFSMKDIETHAKALLLRARQQADQLLAEAQAEGEKLKAAAKTQGLADAKREGLAQGLELGKKTGHQQALDEARPQLQQATAALASAAALFEASRLDIETESIREVIRLAVAIARRVTKRQGLLDSQVLAANIQEVMRMVSDAAKVRIAINPAQRATLDAAIPELSLTLPAIKHVEITDDPSLAPGGCRVFTDHGQIDADLDVQLDRIIADLLPTPAPETP